jgi:hypothetical protein
MIRVPTRTMYLMLRGGSVNLRCAQTVVGTKPLQIMGSVVGFATLGEKV